MQATAGTYKTVTLTFAYEDQTDLANEAYSALLEFRFTVDKDSIGDIVAETALDKFEEVLNNLVIADSYEQLINGMDNRSGWNKGSAITYIGNVAGADSGDSAIINTLFGEDFISMDLDGDGKTEPITMMIKREDLDGNAATGSSYTYTSWGRDTTVSGCEMTIYITAENLNDVGSGDSIVVYASTYTLQTGAQQWSQVVPLTKGTADANNYSGGWGGADSFNTDTWRSENNQTIETLVLNATNFQ